MRANEKDKKGTETKWLTVAFLEMVERQFPMQHPIVDNETNVVNGRKQGKFSGKNFLIRLGFHAEQSSEENAKPKTPLDKYTH